MENNQGFAMGRGGYALAVLSRRCRGHVVPVDLLRVVASVANRAGMRRRVSAAFAGYLVSDSGPGVVPMFSKLRVWHEQGEDLYCMTSERMGRGYRLDGVESGPLDAPDLIAAGCMWSVGDGLGGMAAAHRRYVVSLADAGPGVPIFRGQSGRVVILGGVWTGRASAGDDETLQDEFAGALAGAAIDAPDLLLSGSVVEYVLSVDSGERCAAVDRFYRRGVFA